MRQPDSDDVYTWLFVAIVVLACLTILLMLAALLMPRGGIEPRKPDFVLPAPVDQ